MPLFGSSKTTTTTPPPATTTTTTSPPSRSRTLFSRRRSNSPGLTTANTTTNHRHSTSHHQTAGAPTAAAPKRHSMFSKSGTSSTTHGEDASIAHARERVMSAEAAERDADRALFAARAAVKEARDHVKRLELEAAEEARLAKIKQSQAKAIGKRGKALGRHDHI